MEIIFLGTSSMVPTKARNHCAQLVFHKGKGILVDCGEGTQRQLKLAKIRPCRISKILITHWHGDHVLGLPGLIQTLGQEEYQGTLDIYGPKGSKTHFANIIAAFQIDVRLKIEIHEIQSGIFFENKWIQLSAMPLQHSCICLGYRIQEKDTRRIKISKIKKLGIPHGPLIGKLQNGLPITYNKKKINPNDVSDVQKGKSICLILDTVFVPNCVKLAKNCDLLVCESTFGEEHAKKAKEYKHLTAKEAAKIAKAAKVKQLVLTHFSQRYKNTTALTKEAKKVFPKTKAAKDFLELKV